MSPICLSKIASVLGKPIQCDQPTSTLSRMSYARVLVEIDLLEELQHSIDITLPQGPALHQQVVYETLPKYCHLCHVLGHTHLLCPKAAVTATTVPSLDPAVKEAQGNVFSRLGPCPPLPQLQDQSQDQDIPASQGDVGSPVDLVATNDWVTVVSRRKSSKHAKGKAVAVSELGSVASSLVTPTSPVCTGPVRTSSGAPPLEANSCAEEPRDSPPPSTEPLVLPAWAGEGRNPSPPNPLAITTDVVNMADKPVSTPIVEVSVQSRVRNRNQKQSGRSGRTSPSIANC